jgi:hypothetical protein
MTIPISQLATYGPVTLAIQRSGATPEQLARNLPYGLTYALNRTMEEAMGATERQATRALIIRQQQFLRSVFKVRRRASVRDFQASGVSETRFGLRADDFRGRASVFVDHETGGVRTASGTRAGFLYIPTYGTSLRRTIRDLMPRAWYPKALGIADRRDVDGATIAGKDRTPKRRGSIRGARKDLKAFVVRAGNRTPIGIFRRLGPPRLVNGRDVNLEMIFRLSQRRAIQPRLQFRRTAERVGLERLPDNVAGMLTWALDKARGKAVRALERQTLEALGPGARIDARGVR